MKTLLRRKHRHVLASSNLVSAAVWIMVLGLDVSSNGGTWPYIPAFPPNIPSADQGNVQYSYSFATGANLYWQSCGWPGVGIKTDEVTSEWGMVGPNKVADRARRKQIEEQLINPCNMCGESDLYFRLCTQAYDGMADPPTYSPNADPPGGQCNYANGAFFISEMNVLGCNIVTDVYGGDERVDCHLSSFPSGPLLRISNGNA